MGGWAVVHRLRVGPGRLGSHLWRGYSGRRRFHSYRPVAVVVRLVASEPVRHGHRPHRKDRDRPRQLPGPVASLSATGRGSGPGCSGSPSPPGTGSSRWGDSRNTGSCRSCTWDLPDRTGPAVDGSAPAGKAPATGPRHDRAGRRPPSAQPVSARGPRSSRSFASSPRPLAVTGSPPITPGRRHSRPSHQTCLVRSDLPGVSVQ